MIIGIMDSDMEYAMYIIVNNDLQMSSGKIGAQTAHVSEKIANNILIDFYESTEMNKYYGEYVTYMKYGQKKVILKGSFIEIMKFANDHDAVCIIDEGRTEVPENSLTVIGFYPSNKNKERFKHFRLL
jgi:PTH2 family peptidyl-tRNA hydrolase